MNTCNHFPIYLINSDLPNQTENNTRLDLCQIVSQHLPYHVIDAQLALGVWSLWLKNISARDYMITKVKKTLKYMIDLYTLAPNNTVYKRWSCHSGHKLLCNLCRTFPPPIYRYLGMPVMRTRWMNGAAEHKSG